MTLTTPKTCLSLSSKTLEPANFAATRTIADRLAILTIATVAMIAAMTATKQPRVASPRTSLATRTSRAPSPETSLLSLTTSLPSAVSSLRGFSGPLGFLPTTRMTLTPFKLCTRPICLTCLQRLPLTSMILTHSLFSRVLTLMLIKFKFFYVLCGERTGIVFMFFLSLSCFSRGGLVTHNLSSLPGFAFFFVIS